MQRNRSASVKRRKAELSSSQESSIASESDLSQKRAKTAVNEPSILSHFKVLERQDSVTSNMSSATAEREHKSDSDTEIDGDMDSQEPEPTNRDTMRMLQAINASLISRLDSLSDKVQQMQGEVFDLQDENKKLSKEIERSAEGGRRT